MKMIHFIRHSKLIDKFSDYSKLSFDEFSKIATGEMQPAIATISEEFFNTSYIHKHAITFDHILCATSLRAQQTATMISNILQRDIVVVKTTLLNEIKFDPRLLTNEEYFKKNGMDEIRVSLFNGMLTGKGAESIESIYKRIDDLKEILREQTDSSILCITHSFFMRVLRLYFLEKKRVEEVTPEKLFETHDHTYLDGFSIQLDGNKKN